MDIVLNQKQISNEDRVQINQQVKADLVDHLYQGCLPGTVTGLLVSSALFLDYYGYTPTKWLIAWIIFFNCMMLSLTGLYFFYTKNKNKYDLNTWELAYSVLMAGCALAWVPGILLLPSDMTRAYLALLAVFMATTGYATGTIGQFKLCVITLNIMLVPLIILSLVKGGLFYYIVATFTLLYMSFMCGINLRSTRWFIDSIKLKLENTLVSYQANHDILTDLPNQRLLPQFIDAAIATANSTQTAFALICFSLNRMEMINDSLGHDAGNAIIQSAANRLRALLETFKLDNDVTQCVLTISRTDTFNIVLMPVKPNEEDERLKSLFTILEEPFFLEQKSVKISASVGVSIYPRDGSDAQSLLINADSAMLTAKQFGGNRLEFYRSEINAQMPQRFEMENDLHDALKNHQFQVYYQPLIDIKTGFITGMEALIRWPHPTHGFISPMNFIPVAEETGLILPIGEWVMQEACAQTKLWHQMGFTSLKVAVNLSGKQLQQENLIDIIKRVLLTTGLDAAFVEMEITETAILDEKVIHIIKEFKNLGLGLAVDDFGTGYSGLSYLKRFAIDKLKIDQSFVRDIPGNNDSITIVSAILAMARELNVSSLAEGVETEEQLDFLKGKGCDYAQGYYFSKPIEANSFTQLLLKHRNVSMYSKDSIPS